MNRTTRVFGFNTIFFFAFLCAGTFFFSFQASALGGLKKIAGNVYSYVGVKNATPGNSFGANAGIVIGEEGILVIDTLTSGNEAQRFINDIRKVSNKHILFVVNTHYHLDHTFGNGKFKKLGAAVIAHENCSKNIVKYGNATLENASAYGFTPQDIEGTKIASPVITFQDRLEIDLGGQKVRLIYPGPSHTDGSILVYLPEKKILFAGDMLFTDYHPNLIDGNIQAWKKALDYMLSLEAETIIPGHGPISRKRDVEDMKKYLTIFDRHARKLAVRSTDAEHITAEIKEILPRRSELDTLIRANIQLKYLKNK